MKRTLCALLIILTVGCGGDAIAPGPSPPLELPHGQSELNIAGWVTDVDGEAVYDVTVEGWVGRNCQDPSAWVPTVKTFSSGRYIVRVRIGMSGGTWPGCAFLTFTPAEDSGLLSVSIDSIPTLVYDREDPRARTDTLKVDAVLPKAGGG